MSKYYSKILILVLLAAIFSFGYFIGQNNRESVEEVQGLINKEIDKPGDVDFSLFWDAWRVIETKYVERFDLDREQMVFGAISGLLKSLDDPYSVFMEPEDSKRFIDDIKGSFSGIGAEVGIRQGVLTIISPLEGSPAQAAGLMAGDKVFEVDGTSTMDLSLDEAVNMIRGEKGTAVVLTIIRDGLEEARDFSIIRDTIVVPIIRWEMLALQPGGSDKKIAYVELYHFTENSAQEFRRVADEILAAGAQGLILDLRNNPGGYLETSVDIASYFLPKGELVVIESFGNGNDDIVSKSKGYSKLENMDTVILVNQGSASASEILAGALRDIRGIKIVGQTSFGKGSVQQLEKLRGGSSIKITVAKWLTPSGVSISDDGIIPDYEVELTMEDIDQMKDPQLDKALEVINE